MLFKGAWATICDTGWDNLDAKVVCRQLGFSDVGATPTCCGHFGQGSGSILTDPGCIGIETSLDQCQHLNRTASSCNHYEDAGVICGNKTGKYVNDIASCFSIMKTLSRLAV